MKPENLLTRVQKGELKAKMFEYLRQVEETGEALLVTDHGTPTVIIYPYRPKASVDEILGSYRSKFQVVGDLNQTENDEWGELS